MSKCDKSSVYIVMPAYNESTTIRGVVERVLDQYPHVIVVDDGSSDDMGASLAGTAAQYVRHIVNRGQGAAIQTGVEHALRQGAPVIVTFDADGQHDVDDIEALVAPILAGECDLTLGSRFLGRSSDIPFARKLVLKAGIVFTRIVSRIRVTDVHNGLRAFSHRAAATLNLTMDRMAHASEILDKIRAHGWRYREVPVTIRYSDYSRAKGQSSWNAVRIALKVLLDKVVT